MILEAGSDARRAAPTAERRTGLMTYPRKLSDANGSPLRLVRSASEEAADAAESAESAEEMDATDRMYIVREDDSLSSIARKFYGTAEARRRIVEANRSLIRDSYLIEPGWMLRIPA